MKFNLCVIFYLQKYIKYFFHLLNSVRHLYVHAKNQICHSKNKLLDGELLFLDLVARIFNFKNIFLKNID